MYDTYTDGRARVYVHCMYEYIFLLVKLGLYRQKYAIHTILMVCCAAFDSERWLCANVKRKYTCTAQIHTHASHPSHVVYMANSTHLCLGGLEWKHIHENFKFSHWTVKVFDCILQCLFASDGVQIHLQWRDHWKLKILLVSYIYGFFFALFVGQIDHLVFLCWF